MTATGTVPKTMTSDQIDQIVSDYRALLEKHSGDFSADAVQTVLSQSDFAQEQFVVFRHCVEAVSNFIIRKVPVNRGRTQQEALEATGRVQYTVREVVDAMPKATADETEVVFFKPNLSERNGFISDYDLDKEYELRGLKPADPVSVAAANEADSAFSDKYPNATHWKDAEGNWCHAAFRRERGGVRVVDVNRGYDWDDNWWFAGVRK